MTLIIIFCSVLVLTCTATSLYLIQNHRQIQKRISKDLGAHADRLEQALMNSSHQGKKKNSPHESCELRN